MILVSTNIKKKKKRRKYCDVLSILVTKQPCREIRQFANNIGKKEIIKRNPYILFTKVIIKNTVPSKNY